MDRKIPRLRKLREPKGPSTSLLTFADRLAGLARMQNWKERFEGNDPAYAIPWPACDSILLGKLFPRAEVERETEFASLCWTHGYIGVWKNRPISCAPLRQTVLRHASFDPNHVREVFGDLAPLPVVLQSADGHLESTHERLLGILGFLLTEPLFWDGFKTLRSLAQGLPPDYRPDGPQNGSSFSLIPEGASTVHHRTLEEFAAGFAQATASTKQIVLPPEVTTKLEEYRSALDRFLQKWSLSQVTTWDLVVPQGPLLPDHLPSRAPARPVKVVTLQIPAAYPLLGDDDLLRRVRELQKQQADELGLPEQLVALPHHGQYAQLARLIHLKHTLHSRFDGKPSRGFATTLEQFGAKYLGVSSGAVKRSFKWIQRCLRGDRHTIKELRTKS